MCEGGIAKELSAGAGECVQRFAGVGCGLDEVACGEVCEFALDLFEFERASECGAWRAERGFGDCRGGCVFVRAEVAEYGEVAFAGEAVAHGARVRLGGGGSSFGSVLVGACRGLAARWRWTRARVVLCWLQ